MEQLLALQKLQFDAALANRVEGEMESFARKSHRPSSRTMSASSCAGRKAWLSRATAFAVSAICASREASSSALLNADEVQLCDNCGRYLYLPQDEPSA